MLALSCNTLISRVFRQPVRALAGLSLIWQTCCIPYEKQFFVEGNMHE